MDFPFQFQVQPQNGYLVGAALFAIFCAALARAIYVRSRRPKFLYGDRQSVALVQQLRRARLQSMEERREIRPYAS